MAGWLIGIAAAAGLVAATEPAVVPLEALPAVTGATGEIWIKGMRLRAPLIAEQGLRVAAGIVRTGTPGVLPLTIVGPVTPGSGLPADPARRAWCDPDQGLQLIRGNTLKCYQDLDGDGSLDTERRGAMAAPIQPVTIAQLGPGQPIAPIPYRAATTAELPVYRLVYESCGGGVTPVRFTQRLRDAGGGGLDYACSGVGEAIDAATGRTRIDRIEVQVSPRENSAVATLFAGIPAGTLLDRVMPAEPVYDLGARPSLLAERLAQLQRFGRPAFTFAGEPRVNLAAAGPSDVLIEGVLGFGYTGKVAKLVTISNLTSTRTIEVGEPVYGVPMGGDSRVMPTPGTRIAVTWCAPRLKLGEWRAACVPVQGAATHTIIENLYPAFMVRSVHYRADTIQALGVPEVTEGPVDFGTTVKLRYRVVNWAKKDIRLILEIDTGTGKPDSIVSWVRRQPDGSAVFAIGGGRMRLHPVGTGYRVEVEAPLHDGGNARPSGDVKELLL